MEISKEKEIKIFLTGGHAATTAASVVEEIKRQSKGWKIYFLGSSRAIEGRKAPSLESLILPKMGVTFLNLIAGRIQRKFTIYTIPSLLKIPIGFIQSFYYFLKYKPDLILSFGGYASFPVVLNAYIFKIPTILHEQTTVAGRSSIFSSKFATKVALSRESSRKYFPSNKTVLTGNPVMSNFQDIKLKENADLVPTIFITGGSRGARNINIVIEKILNQLLSNYQIIHLSGEGDFNRFLNIKNSLPYALSKNYKLYSGVTPNEYVEFLDKSDIVISRSGANTVSEIIIAKRPGILIPLPISFLAEQDKNADYAVEYGIAKKIPQKDLNERTLISAIKNILSDYQKIIEKVKNKISPDVNAAKNVVELLAQYLQ